MLRTMGIFLVRTKKELGHILKSTQGSLRTTSRTPPIFEISQQLERRILSFEQDSTCRRIAKELSSRPRVFKYFHFDDMTLIDLRVGGLSAVVRTISKSVFDR